MKQINPRSLQYYGYVVVMALSIFIFFTASCKKDDDDPKKPVITTIGDGDAHIGDTLTITGEHFNDNAEETSVKFGSGSAIILGGTTTTIVVIVPQLDPGTVKVVVKVGTLSSDGTDFTILAPDEPGDETKEIEITDFSPKTIKYDSVLTITGKYFTSDVQVFVNGKEQTKDKTVSSDSTTITVKMASKTYSGEVKLIRGDEEKVFEDELTYELTYGAITKYSDLQGQGIVVDENNTVYLVHRDGLLRLNSNGEVADTLESCDSKPEMSGLFFDKSGDLYIAELYGVIMKKSKDSDDIDTLFNANSAGIQSFNHVDGDNNGNLYFSTVIDKKLVRYNIENKNIEELTSTTNQTRGIVLVGDTLFATTTYEVLKMHVDDDAPTYIIEKADGYGLKGMCLHPSGDIFIAGGTSSSGSKYSAFIIKDGNTNTMEEFIPEEKLNVDTIYDVIADNNGDLLLCGSDLLKVTIY
jgi:hypothetical protein